MISAPPASLALIAYTPILLRYLGCQNQAWYHDTPTLSDEHLQCQLIGWVVAPSPSPPWSCTRHILQPLPGSEQPSVSPLSNAPTSGVPCHLLLVSGPDI